MFGSKPQGDRTPPQQGDVEAQSTSHKNPRAQRPKGVRKQSSSPRRSSFSRNGNHILEEPRQAGEDEPLLAAASVDIDGLEDDESQSRSEQEDEEDSAVGAQSSSSLHRPPWSPPPGFFWIQVAILTNVFLSGFDSTITAATYAVISSDFSAANAASWLSTSYLVTQTAFQPLYGRVSDLIGRRACFLISTATFGLGCAGCAVAPNIVLLNCARAVAGLGGGGLVTMATIVNSDMIPFHRRGMYQAFQNCVSGFGSVSGASFGGSIADTIGWRWCFALQVPISIAVLGVGWWSVQDPPELGADLGMGESHQSRGAGRLAFYRQVWSRIDIIGALLLVLGVSMQLVGLSLGGNQLPWSSPWVWGALAGSFVLLALFMAVEGPWKKPEVAPLIPLRMLRGRQPISTQLANVCVGLTSYAYLFSLPLFFQVVLQESATVAGARLVIPSLAFPIGGLICGVVMSRWGRLTTLVRVGAGFMAFGCLLVASLGFGREASWKYLVYIFPTNVGQGMVYPGLLFTSVATFEHPDHAVSASSTYLIRSVGSVWGVAMTSAILQTTLSTRLPKVLRDVPDKARIIDDIRHSVSALEALPRNVQIQARHIYYEGLHYSFVASAVVALVAVISALFIDGKRLRSTK